MKVINERKVQEVLEYIKSFQMKEGKSPSFRKIAKAACFPSLATAQKYVNILHKRDLIKKDIIGKIVIPTNLSTGKTIVAPLVGKVACGTPILAEENISATYQLPSAIFGSENTMMLKAQGDSMIDVGIYDGDLIVATITNTANNGDIVVALINDSATVKRLFKKKGYAILHPENSKYEDIITKELIIQGIVKHVIHSF